MSYYPIMVELEGQKTLVVGGGSVAQRKIDTLLENGADVGVVSRELTPVLEEYVKEGKIRLLGDEFHEEILEGLFLVIAATDDTSLNHEVGEAAKKKKILINVADQPVDCNFIVPSIVRKGDLIIAISTSGKSPAMAKKMKEELRKQFGREYEQYLVMMGRLRNKILARGMPHKENSRIFRTLVESTILKAIAGEEWEEVAENLSRILQMEVTVDDVLNYLKTE